MNIRNFTIKTLSTFFYVGYLPFFPGTYGSIAGLLIYYFTKDSVITYSLFVLLSMAIGFLVAGRAEKLFGRKDARCIVIDETSGMLLSFMLIPYDIKFLIAAFALFRILDALKPYPAASFEKIKGSMGIMGDDIIAGLYANVILQVVLRLASLRTS